MPKGTDWLLFSYVNLAFILLYSSAYLSTFFAKIKEEWPTFRCNPLMLPFLTQDDHDACLKTTMSGFMGYLLEPLTYITSNLNSMGTEFLDTFNFFRVIISNIRTLIMRLTEGIYGVFVNLITQFQKITIGISDLVGKLIGTVAAFLYILDGSLKTIRSAKNGPPGQAVEQLCFHPDTKVKLQSGDTVSMKDIELGAILSNGSRVTAVIRLDNKIKREALYKLENGVDGSNILVTGSHLVFYHGQYIEVKEHPEARLLAQTCECECDWFSCLMTTDHKIQLGTHLFYDWDDDAIRYGWKQNA